MRLCPLDLTECARDECAGGYCMREKSEPHVTLCWECGEIVDRHGHSAGICIACITVRTSAVTAEH
jgi:hypothetical protein